MTPEEQAALAAQDPAPVAPAAPQPVAAPPTPPASGPWASDLDALFTDPSVRSQVDEYMRTKIQPRMTQLEQASAVNADAERLLHDLQTDPANTMAALADELNWSPAQVQAAVEEVAPEILQGGNQELDPRVQALLDRDDREQANASYEAEMNRLVAEHPGLNPSFMHTHINAADGDFNKGYELYVQYVAEWNAAHAAPADPAVPPPPTLGGQTGSTTPPTQQPVGTIASSVRDFLTANSATNDPPPVS